MIKIPILVRIAIVCVCGIIIGTRFMISPPVLIPILSVLFFFFAVSFFKKFLKFRTSIFLIFLLFIFIFHANIYSSANVSQMGKFKDKYVSLTGVVVSEPDIRKWQTNLVVEADTINERGAKETEPINCKIFVRAMFPQRDIFYGEKYGFSGVLRIPEDGGFRDYLKRNKISAVINVNDRKRIQHIGEERANPLIKQALKLKRILTGDLREYVSPNYFPILGAMMFRTGVVPEQIREIFAKIGIVHILAISGLHVWMVGGIFLFFFRLLRVPRRISYCVVFILIIIYAFITGLRVPVVRASLMINLFLLGYIIRRRADIFVALAVACLSVLLWNPYELFDVGFQLSFVTVLGIALITPRIEEILEMKELWRIIFEKKLFIAGSLKLFFISVAAWLASLPLVAYHFGYVSWVGPFSNLLFIPLATLILMSGFILLLLAWVFPLLAFYFGAFVNFILFLLLRVSEIVSSWRFVSNKLPEFNISFVFLYYFALLLILFYPKLKKLFIKAENV